MPNINFVTLFLKNFLVYSGFFFLSLLLVRFFVWLNPIVGGLFVALTTIAIFAFLAAKAETILPNKDKDNDEG